MKKILRRLAAAALALPLVLLAAIPAAAVTYVTVKGQNFVADTFCGVPAYYDEGAGYDGKWQCNEYINRFYAEAYGLHILAYRNTGLVMQQSGYAFRKTTAPKPGDILYSPAARRGKSSDHWAIVKSFSNGKATLIEQNYLWDGKAGVNRSVAVPDPGDTFDIWTPVALSGADPQLPAALMGKEPAAPKPTTTQKATSTAKKTTAKPATATRQKTTTAKPVFPTRPPDTTPPKTTTSAPATAPTTPAVMPSTQAETIAAAGQAAALTQTPPATKPQAAQASAKRSTALKAAALASAAVLLLAILLAARRKNKKQSP
jgi:hypothetical protein